MTKIIKQNKAKISSLEDEVNSMRKKLNLYESNNKDNKSDLEEINKKLFDLGFSTYTMLDVWRDKSIL